MGITAPHTANKSGFLLRMLTGMGLRASGFRKQGLGRAVIAPAKAVDKLAVAMV